MSDKIFDEAIHNYLIRASLDDAVNKINTLNDAIISEYRKGNMTKEEMDEGFVVTRKQFSKFLLELNERFNVDYTIDMFEDWFHKYEEM